MSHEKQPVLTPGGVRDLVTSFLQKHPAYREAFLADPTSAIAHHLGLAVPAGELRAVADTLDTVHVVVPPDPSELGDADLGHVAGGTRSSATAAVKTSWSYVDGGITHTDSWDTQV